MRHAGRSRTPSCTELEGITIFREVSDEFAEVAELVRSFESAAPHAR